MFSEYLLSGLVPSVKEVNDDEPLFPAFPLLIVKPTSEVGSFLVSLFIVFCSMKRELEIEYCSKVEYFSYSSYHCVSQPHLSKNLKL